MKPNLLALVMFVIGALLVYCGIRDINPVDMVKAVVSGGTLPAPGSAKAVPSTSGKGGMFKLNPDGSTTPDSGPAPTGGTVAV